VLGRFIRLLLLLLLFAALEDDDDQRFLVFVLIGLNI
jgi:hypothetical protein